MSRAFSSRSCSPRCSVSDTPDVALVRAQIVDALVGLEDLFVHGMVLTFIAAHPTNPNAHMVVTTALDLQAILDTIRETAASRGETVS